MSVLLASCTGGDELQVCADGGKPTVDVAVDTTIGSSQTSSGVVVPLVVRASIPCLEGVAHASVFSSAGQFSSSGSAASSGAVRDAGAEGGASSSSGGGGGGDGGSGGSQGASTTVTLTPNGVPGEFLGFTTLALSSAQLLARLQVIVGDSSTCQLLSGSATGTTANASITSTGTCEP
jgi:hypothetical protein